MTNSEAPNVLVVIPARYASSRFPGKPLALIAGQADDSARGGAGSAEPSCPSRIVVATDDERIKSAVEGFGGEAMLSRARSPYRYRPRCRGGGTPRRRHLHQRPRRRAAHRSRYAGCGSRCHAGGRIHPASHALLRHHPAKRDHGSECGESRAGFRRQRACIFRARRFLGCGIPARPSPRNIGSTSACTVIVATRCWNIPTLPPGELERIEQLEQLRWLENGFRIHVVETEYDAVSVDVPADVERVEKLLSAGAKS